MLGGCCVCADENGWESNPLVYCDGPNCEVAVHQGCYGIVEVPEGEWYCAKCADLIAHTQYNGNSSDVGEVRENPRCKLCPFGHGALKRTDNDEWAHVICALYIPEVRFGDVHSMDPVILSDVPLERFQQQCYLCMERGEEKRAYLGACMPCNKLGCKKCFHVTCAQAKGLLCEEGGGSKNVKYCGYCTAHAKKAISDPLIKIIPPYRHRAESSCSSGSGGGGGGGLGGGAQRAVSPKLGVGSICNGDINRQASTSCSPQFTTSELLQNPSPAFANNYGGSIKLAITTSSSGTATSSFSSSNLRSEGSAMLVDPIHRTSLPPTTVDRAMLSAVMSHSLAHSIHDDACSPPMSSGRSSTAHSTPPPVATTLPTKKDQSGYEVTCSSSTSVPLPANVGYFSISAQKNDVLARIATDEKDLNNGSLVSQLEIKLPSRTNYGSDNSSLAAVGSKSALVKRKAVDGMDKPKRPRNNKACKSMKALLESVGPLISETVSDFQRERVNERDGSTTTVTTPHSTAPSTSGEQETLPAQCVVVPCSPMTVQQQKPGLSTIATTVPSTTLVGVPLMRTQPKAALGNLDSSSMSTTTMTAVDRTHVTASLPSTSGAIPGTAQPVSFPQSMEELLERQWEQGSHFLMSHAPFDIAQLLSCLHELKMENVRLEETLSQLARRRDHLLALNTRLSLSLASGSSLGIGASPHHSPRINNAQAAAAAGAAIPLGSIGSMQQQQQSSSGISSSTQQCSTQPTSSSSSLSSLSSSIVPLPTTACVQQQPPSIPGGGGGSAATSGSTAVTSFLNPFCSGLPTVAADDSLSQLRSLATNGSVISASRSVQQTSQSGASVAGQQQQQLVGSGASECRQTPITNAVSGNGTTTTQQTSLSSSRIPSVAPENTGISTPLLANFNGAQLVTSKASTAPPAPNTLDLFGGSQNNAHLTLNSERQQIAAAAIAAAAAANALGGNFVAPRTPTHMSTAVSGASTIGQLAPAEILAQYALLAQQQLLHQQAAAAALNARYGGQVISSSSTPPHSTSSNSQISSNPHQGK